MSFQFSKVTKEIYLGWCFEKTCNIITLYGTMKNVNTRHCEPSTEVAFICLQAGIHKTHTAGYCMTNIIPY